MSTLGFAIWLLQMRSKDKSVTQMLQDQSYHYQYFRVGYSQMYGRKSSIDGISINSSDIATSILPAYTSKAAVKVISKAVIPSADVAASLVANSSDAAVTVLAESFSSFSEEH
ncbi:hypothetical protein EAE99_012406 [Botrytis elliptica]|nr:hypothetical protein EAE99_012406 [Botrytis elliptica]